MEKDASDFMRRCDKCQQHANYPRQSPNELVSMTSPWPFAVWGIDLIGALPTRRGGPKYTVVAVDYFTKWVEAEPLVNITASRSPPSSTNILFADLEYLTRSSLTMEHNLKEECSRTTARQKESGGAFPQ